MILTILIVLFYYNYKLPDFIIDNKIDCVIIGEEYKGNNDKIWYKGAIELNKYKYIKRYENLSTSIIIDKIIKFYEK